MRRTTAFLGASALLGLLLVFALACGGGSKEQVKTYKVGQDAKVGSAIWHVTSVQKADQFPRKDGTGVIKAQGVFVLVEAQMKNDGAEETVLTGEELDVVDKDNTIYSIDLKSSGIDLVAIGKENLISGSVAPGETAKGFVIFDVGKDARGLKLKARDIDIRSNKYVFIDLGV